MNKQNKFFLQDVRRSALYAIGSGMALGLILVIAWKSINAFRFNGLASPLFLALCFFCCGAIAFGLKFKIPLRWLASYLGFALWIFSVDLMSIEFIPAFARDMHWLLLPWFAAICSRCVSDSNGRLIVLVSVAGSIVLLVKELFDNAGGVISWVYPPVFGNIRHLALTVSVFTLFLFGAEWRQPLVRYFFRVARVLGLALVIWSGSRAALLGMLLSVLVIFFGLTNKGDRTSLVIDIFIAFSLAQLFKVDSSSLGFTNAITRSLSASGLDELSSFRLTLWAKTLEGLQCHDAFLTGMGGNGFARLGLGVDSQMVQPHNFILQMIADWGLVGLSIFLLGVVQVFRLMEENLDVPLAYRRANQAVLLFIVYSAQLDASLYHLEHLVYFGIALAGSFRVVNSPSIKYVAVTSYSFAGIVSAFSIWHFQLLDYRLHLTFRPLLESAC